MDETFYRVSFFDCNVTYYRFWYPVETDDTLDSETQFEDLPGTDWREPPAGYKPGSRPSRVQSSTVEIDENSVVFSCTCGDDDTRVETQRLFAVYLRETATRLLTMAVTPTSPPPLCLSPGSSSARIIDIPDR